MIPKEKYELLDKLSSKCNIAEFKVEFNSLSPVYQKAYAKSLGKNGKPFKDNPNVGQIFRRGIYILDRGIFNKIYGEEEKEVPFSMNVVDFENYLSGVILSMSESKDFIKRIAKIISHRDDEVKIMDFIKRVDEDLFKKILSKLPNAKKAEQGATEIITQKHNHDGDDDEFKDLNDNPFSGEGDENYEFLRHQYEFKAESLAMYFNELSKKEIPLEMIKELILMESVTLDSQLGRD